MTNRIALLKTLEILAVMFEWVPSPLSLLLEDEPVDLEGDTDIKKGICEDHRPYLLAYTQSFSNSLRVYGG